MATDPADEPLSLVVVTQRDVRRVWPGVLPGELPNQPAPPALPAPPAQHNHTLPALNVRAIDFHYTNRFEYTSPLSLESAQLRPYSLMFLCRTICYVHHNISKSGIVCVAADDFSRRTVMPTPDLFPDVAGKSSYARQATGA